MNDKGTQNKKMGPQGDHARQLALREHPSGSDSRMESSAGARASSVPARQSPSGSPVHDPLEARGGESPQTPTRSAIVNTPYQQMVDLIAKSGEEGFSQDVIDVLRAPIDDGIVGIKPNGIIYVTHIHYRDRLDNAFGVGGWCLVPLDKPRLEGRRAIYHGFLKAGGRYIADAIGGCDYIPSNNTMNLDDAVEGAKSDCLVRCCKVLPMFRECWDPEYVDYWKATYAHEVAMPNTRTGRGWKKKGEYMRNFNTKPGKEGESEFRKQPRVEDENNAHIDAINDSGRLLIKGEDTEWADPDFCDDSRE